LQARNLEAFKDSLHKAGMLHLAGDFVRASGALTILFYREKKEAALRTPAFGGFQLLDLQDFPGQGKAGAAQALGKHRTARSSGGCIAEGLVGRSGQDPPPCRKGLGSFFSKRFERHHLGKTI
jgi:hypothetical protein